MTKVQQWQLPKPTQRNLRWGSHVALNESILKTFSITGVLELGAGLHSTPLFFKMTDYVISVEADIEWINKLRNENLIQEDENHKIIHHSLPKGIIRSTRRQTITKAILEEANTYYKSLISDKLNFLFVDCYSGFRLEALRAIHEHFDVVTYHDAHPSAEKNHAYEQFQPSNKFEWYRDVTFITHTGLLIKKDLAHLFPELKKQLKSPSKKYADKFNTVCDVLLVEPRKLNGNL